MDQPRITPSRWYFALAGAVFVGGWVLFAVFLFEGLSGMEKNLQQALAPGVTDIVLQTPGEYTISYEYHSVFREKVYSTDESISGLECALVSKQSSSRVRLSPSRMNTTYEFGGRAGRSVFNFTVQQPGAYSLTSSYPEGQTGPEIVLAVGKDSTAGLFLTIAEALASVLGSLLIAVTIAVITIVKRNNCKKHLPAHSA
jgi:hypothetical protein